MQNPSLFSTLARSILAGEMTEDHIVERLSRTLSRKWRWLRPLARRYVATFGGGVRPRRRDVVDFLRRDERFERARRLYSGKVRIAEWVPEPQRMDPVAKAAAWAVP